MAASQPRRNPYVGPRAFERGDTLYGRNRELRRLLNLLIAERIVLLYSPSGAGKTSLIQAALIPELEAEGFRVWPAMRVNRELPPAETARTMANRYVLSLLLSLEEDLPQDAQISADELAGMTLEAYLGQRTETKGEVLDEVFVFDQFEEILILDPTDRDVKFEFFEQLGDTLQDRRRWALFAMREELIAGLDPYLRPLPTRFSASFRLELLSPDAARQAMQKPAQTAGVKFTDGAAEQLVDDLRTVRILQSDGARGERLGLYVEPVQLQVVCRHLWERLSPDATQIVEADLEAVGDVDRALAIYYAGQVEAIAAGTGVSERTIREWIDRQLITEQGVRGQVLQEPEQSRGLDNQVIGQLVDVHLMRAEERRGATWFELAHDRLIAPVRGDNAAWRMARLSVLQRQAALWEDQHRPGGLLLRDEALTEAEAWAESHEAELTKVETKFLLACQEIRAAAEKERRQSRRIRWLAVGATILAIIAILLAVFSWTQRQEALAGHEQAETQAREARMAVAGKLAVQAQAAVENHPQRGLLLAVEALNALQRDDPRVPSAEQVLRDALGKAGGLGPSGLGGLGLSGHEGSVWSVAFSPDGHWLATGSEDATARLWDLAAEDPGVEPLVLAGHRASVLSVAFSPDGHWLATGSEDKTVRLWDLGAEDPRAEPLELTGHEGPVLSVAFSPDGRWLATGSGDKLDDTARLWDLGAEDPGAESLELTGHEGPVLSIAFSPDGHWLATGSGAEIYGSNDDTARLWNLEAEDPAAEPVVLAGHRASVLSVVFSPDGRWLATGSDDATARLWDLEAEDPAAEPVVLAGHRASVLSVAFSPDGRRLATGSLDDTARLWDLEAEDPAAEPLVLTGHEGDVVSVAFSPDGRWLATGSLDDTARLWDLRLGWPAVDPRIASLVQLDLGGDLYKLQEVVWMDVTESKNLHHIFIDVVDEQGQRLVGEQIRVSWADGETNLVTEEKPGEPWSANFGMFATLGSYAVTVVSASGTSDSVAGLGMGTPQQPNIKHHTSFGLRFVRPVRRELTGHEGSVLSVAFSRDGRWLATGSLDDTARLWDLGAEDPGAEEPLVLAGHDGSVYSVAFSPDGHWLATGSRDELDDTARLWDLGAEDPGAEPLVLAGHEGLVYSVAFSPDGRWLASGSGDKLGDTARLWDLEAEDPGAEPLVLAGHEGSVYSVAFSPDGRWLASGSEDKTTRLWDLGAEDPAAEPVVLAGHEGSVASVAFSPDGRWLATGSEDKTARLWDLGAEDPGAEPLVLAGHEGPVLSVAFSPDGRWLATSSGDGTARLWDLGAEDPGAEPVVLAGHEGSVLSVAFSRDGRWLATGSYDDTARLWDLGAEDPGAEPLVLAGHEDPVRSVAFSPYGRWLASGSEDGTVRLWRLQMEELKGIACRVAGRNIRQDEWVDYFRGQDYRRTCERLPAHPSVVLSHLDESLELARAGDVQGALAGFQQAVDLDSDFEISTYYWKDLCWFGSLWDQAADVLHACEQAVALTPDDGRMHDSRGLARALTGDLEGAVEDFEFYVEWLKHTGQYEKGASKRESWIDELKAGRNPFDEEILKALRDE
jgi:WD40 repeat protein/heme exporter protein D